MPAESARLRRRLSPRDWWFLGLVSLAITAGIVVSVVIATRSSTNPRCVATTRAWVMGAETYTVCGQQAVTFCNKQPQKSTNLAAQCARVEALVENA